MPLAFRVFLVSFLPVPAGLIDLLPPALREYERTIVGGKIIFVAVATQIIHDVLVDVVFR